MAHFVILGCGRVGVALAHTLEAAGHSVAVVDRDPHRFTALGEDFAGTTVAGVGFDREVLQRAGIEQAAGLAAVSADDGTNVIAARVAREHYGVRQAVARIYDPERATVYQRLGVSTVAAVQWTSDRILSRLLPAGAGRSEHRDASGGLLIGELTCAPSWYGRSVGDLEEATEARVAYLTRFGEGVVPTGQTLLQEGDVVHLVHAVSRRDEVEALVAGAPEEES
ncbi:potassium channel family protein [Micrococcus luteus]